MAQQFGAPDFAGNILQGLEAGYRTRQRNKLAELDERGRQLAGEVASGQKNKLAELMGVNPQLGMQVASFTEQQKKDWLEDFSRQAYAADDLQKWQAMIDRYKAQGREFAPGEDLFENRDALITSAMSVGDRLGLDLRRDETKRSQANADRAYDLQRQGFNADQSYREQQIALERDKLNKPDLTSDLKEYNFAVSQGFKGSYVDFKNSLKSNQQFDVTLPDGTVIRQGSGKALTEGQSKDVVYLTRMSEAVPIIDQMGDKLLSFGENVGGQMPVVGNYLKSPEYQQAEQAAGQWRQGFLRKDSGATITDQETADTNRLYIPQPGDKGPVLRQKAQARRTATLAVKMGIPYQAVMEMQKNGVDLDKVLNAPLPSGNLNSGGKSDKAGASPNRTQNGINWSID